MGEVTKEQREHVIKELEECEKRLAHAQGAWKDYKRLGTYSMKFWDILYKEMEFIFNKSKDLAVYINGLNNDKPPFILFQGDPDCAMHSVPLMALFEISSEIENAKFHFFDSVGNRIVNHNVLAQSEHNQTLSLIEYSLAYFRTLRNAASKEYSPTQFHLDDVVRAALKYWSRTYEPTAKVSLELKDKIVEFDKEALYWIVMRMLRNAQYATQNVEGGWIVIQVFRHEDGIYYLIVRNNGKSVEDMAREVPYTRTSKTIRTMERICKAQKSSIVFKDFPDHTRACLRLPLARKAVTPEQRAYVTKKLKECEEILDTTYEAVRDKKKMTAHNLEYLEVLSKKNYAVFKKTLALSSYINDLDSDELPFNLFQGDLNFANHAMPSNALVAIPAFIENLKTALFDNAGNKVKDPKVEDKKHKAVLSEINFTRNCLRIFRKLASGESNPEKFRLKTVLDKVLKDRPFFSHNKEVVFNVPRIEDAELFFDKDALYWIAMRMLSNAEHATKGIENVWIRMQTCRGKDGNLYLIVRNNGRSMEEMAAESRRRGGGKSRPNIDKLCKDLDSEFRLKGFPDHTRACLRLPLAESKK